MNIIFSDVPPLSFPENGKTFEQVFEESLSLGAGLYAATGYTSKAALEKLDSLVHDKAISKVVLVLGMYCIEGFPESIYNTAMRLHKRWKIEGIGEIRCAVSMKYHGKLFGFSKDGKTYKAVVGSHNLSALAKDAANLRQYEISLVTENCEECALLGEHLREVCSAPVSKPIDEIDNVNIIREKNTKLVDVEGAAIALPEEIAKVKSALTSISFSIPLKVPGIPGEHNDYMKSNINKAYAKGRLNTRTGVVTERGWWETEVIVSNIITSNPNYPDGDVAFFVFTDDGWKFQAHCCGDYKKNFESDGDLKILGYWLKGRLVAAGIVDPVDSPSEDLKNVDNRLPDMYANCKGVITYAKLKQYGRTSLSLQKASYQLEDDSGRMRDVWLLSFLP